MEETKVIKLIENLAISVKDGFDRVDGRLDKIEKKVNDIDTDLRSFKLDTTHRLDNIEEKVDELIDTTRNFDSRIEKLEEKVF